jgi:signal transduction histidine kinase
METMIRHELPRDAQLKYLDYMLADVDRLTDNINGILNLARLEGKVEDVDF